MAWRKRYRRQQQFVMLLQSGITLLTDRRLGLQCMRVFLMLLAHMKWHGEVLVSQTQIAEALGMSRANVHDAIERLIGYGLVLRDRKIGGLAVYRISPLIAHRGTYVSLYKAQRQAAAQQRLEGLSEALKMGQALDVTEVTR